MTLPVRIARKSTEQTYSISAAAHALGCSIYLLRKLEAQGVISPRRCNDGVRSRIFTEADLQRVLRHYRAKGGIRDAVALKRATASLVR